MRRRGYSVTSEGTCRLGWANFVLRATTWCARGEERREPLVTSGSFVTRPLQCPTRTTQAAPPPPEDGSRTRSQGPCAAAAAATLSSSCTSSPDTQPSTAGDAAGEACRAAAIDRLLAGRSCRLTASAGPRVSSLGDDSAVRRELEHAATESRSRRSAWISTKAVAAPGVVIDTVNVGQLAPRTPSKPSVCSASQLHSAATRP